MPPPLVSVIIPAYNAERFVLDAVESALAQEYQPTEIIVVDDGSTDRTRDRLREYEGRITVIARENGGVAAARNAGVDKSCGSLLAFLDADDVWEPSFLSRLVSLLDSREDAALAFSDLYRFQLDDKTVFPKSNTEIYPLIWNHTQRNPSIPGSHRLPSQAAFRLLLEGYPVFPSTVVLRRAAFEQAGRWDTSIRRSEDLDCWLRCSRIGDFLYLDQRLTGMARHDSHLSGSPMTMAISDIGVLRSHAKHGRYATPESRLIRYHLGKRLCGAGWNFLHNRNFTDARKTYAAALAYPSSFTNALVHLPLTFAPIYGVYRAIRSPND